MNSLYQHSINTILKNQQKSGAILASPNFPTYQYSWFRDGSFSAYALQQAGHFFEAGKFHLWASKVILRYQDKIVSCINGAKKTGKLVASSCLHSRFTEAGEEVSGNWGHHQLDGLGTWLWALGEFLKNLGDPADYASCFSAADLASEYLTALWKLPCSDCWEENETLQHTYTLASIYAGLQSYSEIREGNKSRQVAGDIRRFIIKNCHKDGVFVKSIGLSSVDANLLGLWVPYAVVDWSDPVFQATLSQIEYQLATPIGVHRYAADTFYGSGEWVLLTAWLGWAYARAGLPEKAKQISAWVEHQQDDNGDLPEQVPHALFAEQEYDVWVRRWGPIAKPLVWSHAKYVILINSILAV